MNGLETLNAIAAQTAVCERCKLHFSRKHAVPGAGSATAAVLFIGEGPGFYENEQGLPFVGAAGEFLDDLLAEAEMSRESVFITNVVKCRPPGNRDPQEDELAACQDFLDRQIAAIDPDLIVTLGRFSMGRFVPHGKISSLHGRPSWWNGMMIVPMYHPAAALHQPSLRPVIMADFGKLPALLREARAARANQAKRVREEFAQQESETLSDPSADQLSLFQ